jgi:hypothetical protein
MEMIQEMRLTNPSDLRILNMVLTNGNVRQEQAMLDELGIKIIREIDVDFGKQNS